MVIIAQGKYTVKSQVDTTGFSKIQQQVNLSIKQLEKMRVSSKNVFNEFSKGGKEAQTRVQLLEKEIKDINAELVKQFNLQSNADKAAIRGLKERQKLANAELQTMKAANAAHMQGMGDIVTKVGKFMVATTILGGFTTAVYSTVDSVLKLDKAMTELSKVSDLSGESLEKFKQQAYEVGIEIGRTGTEVIQATTEFAKAGFGSQDALMLGKVATLYQNIADEEISAGDAASFLISQMKAFNISAADSESIIDAVNQVANKFAVSSGDLATAIPKVASTMAQAGNSMSETLALVTAGTEMMPNQAGRVARGLRSITLNLQGMTDEGEKSLELTAKMEDNFNKIGITLIGTDGQLKSTFDILKELSEVYPTLDSNTKNYYSALIGGKTQVDVVNSIISNFSTALGANEEAINSAGSAMRENERYIESIAGHIAVLKSQFELLSQGLSAEFIKDIITAATSFLEFANNIGLAPIVIGVLVGAISSALIPAIFTISEGIVVLNANLTLTNVLMGGLPLVIGLVTGALVYSNIAFKEHNKQMLLAEGQIKVATKSYKELQKEIDATNKSHNEQLVSTQQNNILAEKYIKTIEDLTKKEKLSAYEKAKMRGAVDNLNSVIPDLNLSIDETTGKLVNNIAEVRTAASEYINLAKAQIYQATIAEKAKTIAETSMALEAKRLEIEGYMTEGNKNLTGAQKAVREQAKIDYKALLKQSNQLNSELDETIEKAKQYADKVGDLSKVKVPGGDDDDDDSGGGGGVGSETEGEIRGVKEALDDYIKSLEHELYLMEQRKESEEDRVAFMRKIQEAIHNQANYYRSLNLAETSSEIQSLQKMWWQYENNIATIRLNALQKQATDMESVASYVADKYNQRIKDLQESRRLEEESWNAQIEAIRSTNEALEDNIALQEAQEALARAKSNKVRVYREGQGFVYEEDVTAVSEARKNLDKLNREQQLKDEVARLEKLKKQALDNIDTQIKRWEDYSKSWSEVASNYKKDQDKLLAEQLFGINTEQAGWEERLGNAKSFVAQYNALMSQIGAASGAALGGGAVQTGSNTVKVGSSGVAPKGLPIGTVVQTAGGNYKITGTGNPNSASGYYSQKLAVGTDNATAGLANVDEHGSELILRNPPSGRMTYMEKGDGVVPANLTKNLMEWGKFNPSSFTPNATGGGSSIVYQIDNLTLPSVRNAEDLINGLQTLKTRAMQKSKSRE